jgi:cell division transport system permease protein
VAASTQYFVKETTHNLWRNRLMTLAAILTVGVSLALAGSALLLRQGVSSASSELRGGVPLTIFMNADATPSQLAAVRAELQRDSEVKSVRFYGKANSFAEFQRMFAGEPDLLHSVTESDLPPSFRVTLRHVSEAEAVGQQFQGAPGVKQVAYAKKAVDTMLSVTRFAQLVILVLAVVLLGSALVLILNTIRMAIFARRREVAIMKLVGATNWFIRIPFMLEGLVEGFLGAIGAGLLVLGIEALFSEVVHHYHLSLLQFLLVPAGDVVLTEVAVLVVGVLVGTGGSLLAIHRFLDV